MTKGKRSIITTNEEYAMNYNSTQKSNIPANNLMNTFKKAIDETKSESVKQFQKSKVGPQFALTGELQTASENSSSSMVYNSISTFQGAEQLKKASILRRQFQNLAKTESVNGSFDNSIALA